MLENIRILLGEAATNFSNEQIELFYKMALAEVETYCNRLADLELEYVAARIAVIKLNRINTEGLASQSFSGVSESYVDGLPQDIMQILNRKRKVKIL
jgi:hypothetical protein